MTRPPRSALPAPTTCPSRREAVCEPLNQVVIGQDDSAEAYAACTCGRRFLLSNAARHNLAAALSRPPSVVLPTASGTARARSFDPFIAEHTWPADRTSALSKRGVVPIGVPVLHRAAEPVTVLTPALAKFGLHMISVMRDAEGIGLAANQAGMPLRLFAHNLPRVLPQVIVNPEIIHAFGSWKYSEGCLSLAVDGTHAVLARPRVVIVRGVLLDGRAIIVRADELLARVFQHEIDHLDGIEYVQRLPDPPRSEIYEIIASRDVDLANIPPKPYLNPRVK